MKRDRLENYQWMKFFERWGFLLAVIIIGFGVQMLMFFENLNGTRWIYFFITGFALMLFGAAMIAFAKFPAYRGGHFLTFGIKSVPEHLARCYQWGWRFFYSA